MRDEPKIQKPRAEMHWEYGAGYFNQMDMECWLSGIRRELETFLIDRMDATAGYEFFDFIRDEIVPFWPLLGDFLLTQTSAFYDSYMRYLKKKRDEDE